MKISTNRSATTIAVGMAFLPTIAAASSSGAEGGAIPMPNAEPGNFLGSLLWVMIALAIVVTLIILMLRWLSIRNQLWGGNRSMRSLGGVALGQKSSMQVVEIGGRIYIVGVAQEITLLDKLVDPEEAAALIKALDNQPKQSWSPSHLSNVVRKWRNRHNNQDDAGMQRENGVSTFEVMLRNKLDEQIERKQQFRGILQDSTTNERLTDYEK